MKYFRKQKGVAIIVVALSMVAIGGMAQLAIEGGRMIQETNRLADASEAATLAVAIANSTDQDYSDKVARDYLEQYLPNVAINDVNVVRKEGQQKVDGNTLYYVQYEVEANATFDAQMNFLGNDGVNITETRSVDNDAMARTYMLPSDLDLVFIADFSQSMNTNWGNSNKSRLEILKAQIKDISNDLLDNDATNAGYAHRIGFVPYNMRTQEVLADQKRCVTELEYKTITVEITTASDKRPGRPPSTPSTTTHQIAFNDINWAEWGKKSTSFVEDCAEGKTCNISSVDKPQIEAEAIRTIFSSAGSNWPDAPSYVNLGMTVEHWNTSKTQIKSLHPESSKDGTELFSGGMCGGTEDFNTIPLSLQAPDIEHMKANGGTSVYQGLIRGAQILAEGRPVTDNPDELEKYYERAQMLLILSDGQEDPFTKTFSALVSEGLCGAISTHFQAHDSQLYIGVIGIDFDASDEVAFETCANDIIDVENSDDLKEKIQELIQKGAATNGVSRLYDKTL